MRIALNYSMKKIVNKHSKVIETITNHLKGIISRSDNFNNEQLRELVENTVFESNYISIIDYNEITEIINAIC